jgi:hypothetical protein
MKKRVRIILIISIAALILAVMNKFNYSNCKEAFRRGHINMKKSNIFYRKSLDRDKDGIACEI